jgi:hypothetical protein
MRYMLMMHAPRGTGDWGVMKWSPDDLKAHITFMKDFSTKLGKAGELVGAEGLAPPGEARVVRAGKNGAPAVTDGPFAEAKELISYALYDVRTIQEAVEWTNRFLAVHRDFWPGWEGQADVLKVFGPEDFAPQA